jgi:signal transduction histidine kinase
MYSHLATDQLQQAKYGETSNSLQVMQRSSSDMVKRLNDIVWLLHPEHEGLQQLAERLQDYAQQMCVPGQMVLEVQGLDALGKLSIANIDARKAIYLVGKEAINNAVKHSGGRHLWLQFSLAASDFSIEVADDGRGMGPLQNGNGHGLRNMQERAKEAGGCLVIADHLPQGTLIRFVCKIT